MSILFLDASSTWDPYTNVVYEVGVIIKHIMVFWICFDQLGGIEDKINFAFVNVWLESHHKHLPYSLHFIKKIKTKL